MSAGREPPDSKGRPGSDPDAQTTATPAASSSLLIVDAGADIRQSPHQTGCPCGCESRPLLVDDPRCIRHLPVPEPRDWGGYDVVTLGLAPHDREQCEQCRAVAS